MRLETARLVLRPFTEDDFEGLRAFQSRPDVTRFLLWGPNSDDEVREALERRLSATKLESEGDALQFAVVRKDTGALIGDVMVQLVSVANRTAEIGYVFNPDHQGHGYASEAAAELLRLSFGELGLHRVVGGCDARNTASAAVMERLGMRREAHFRKLEYVKGEWCDELVYAMLAEEWTPR